MWALRAGALAGCALGAPGALVALSETGRAADVELPSVDGDIALSTAPPQGHDVLTIQSSRQSGNGGDNEDSQTRHIPIFAHVMGIVGLFTATGIYLLLSVPQVLLMLRHRSILRFSTGPFIAGVASTSCQIVYGLIRRPLQVEGLIVNCVATMIMLVTAGIASYLVFRGRALTDEEMDAIFGTVGSQSRVGETHGRDESCIILLYEDPRAHPGPEEEDMRSRLTGPDADGPEARASSRCWLIGAPLARMQQLLYPDSHLRIVGQRRRTVFAFGAIVMWAGVFAAIVAGVASRSMPDWRPSTTHAVGASATVTDVLIMISPLPAMFRALSSSESSGMLHWSFFALCLVNSSLFMAYGAMYLDWYTVGVNVAGILLAGMQLGVIIWSRREQSLAASKLLELCRPTVGEGSV